MTVPPRVEVHEDAATLATAVAGELLLRLAEVQAAGHVPQIALTGGTIAAKIHTEVARLSPTSAVDWSQVVIWWGDERFVAPDDPDRNELQARDELLDHVGVDPANVHAMPSTAAGADPAAAAEAYSADLRSHGSGEFDVLMLGVGPDGHIASLFPGFPQLDVTDTIAVSVTGSPKPPPTRISLTFPALNRSRSVWFLVSGDEKADAVARALAGDADVHTTPASGVHGSQDTTWFLDRPAASQL